MIKQEKAKKKLEKLGWTFIGNWAAKKTIGDNTYYCEFGAIYDGVHMYNEKDETIMIIGSEELYLLGCFFRGK